jgi:hypothetical protein
LQLGLLVHHLLLLFDAELHPVLLLLRGELVRLADLTARVKLGLGDASLQLLLLVGLLRLAVLVAALGL